MKKKVNNKYAFGTYKPNKNCKPVTYKGTEYLSKAQCMALERITRKELEEYLQGEVKEENNAPEDLVAVPGEEVDFIDDLL